MILEVFPSGPADTNCIVLACSHTKSAAVIDAPPDSFEAVENFLQENGLKLQMLLLTHSHWDHIADAAKWKQKYATPIYVHSDDAANLERPGSDGLQLFVPVGPAKPDHLLKDGEKLKLGNLDIEVIHTPGHTPGGVCFYLEKQGVLISGDTLFRGTIGRLDLPTGRAKKMWDSLKRLAQLPPETQVFPGHGGPTTIGRESWLKDAQHKFGEI